MAYAMERNEYEIKQAIKDQLIYIKNSCDLYDAGCKAEAIRIATAINTLVINRKKADSRGILRKINYPFKLLSTVPEAKTIDQDKLVVLKKQTLEEACKLFELRKNQARQNIIFFLIYILNESRWYIFAYDNSGNEISCPLPELPEQLGIKVKKIAINKWVEIYSNKNHDINDIGKRIIYNHLSHLLNYNINYVGGLYLPMITNVQNKDVPLLSNSLIKYIDLDQWENEIIFCLSDKDRGEHILTREKLIKSARDQDGGAHYDIKLDVISYYKSKYGEVLYRRNGADVTTGNFHLIMLRQLGYEILNSPSIMDYIAV